MKIATDRRVDLYEAIETMEAFIIQMNEVISGAK